jgi:hypothetical protein
LFADRASTLGSHVRERTVPPIKTIAIASLIVGSLAIGTPANACGGDPYNTGFVHQTIPDSKTAVAAQVEIVAMRRIDAISGESEGRIIKMLRGSYAGPKIIVRTQLTSCDQLPWPGEKGIVAGEVISSTDDALVISPVRTLSEREIYLKTGKHPSN